MEIIESIEETTFKLNDSWYGGYDGFVIKTSEQTIKIGIENGQSCCENWGYLISEDDLNRFIGSILLNVSVTDTALQHVEVPDMYEGDTMFVNIDTSSGTLQFVAYNEHNGYYGHNAVVVSKQCDEQYCL